MPTKNTPRRTRRPARASNPTRTPAPSPNGKTDITILIDRSGSMASIADSTIEGFNTFLREQQGVPGEASMTLIQFDNEYQVVYKGTPIRDTQPLSRETFVPRGGTALLDAIGRSISETKADLAALAPADRPGKTLFVIVTDGAENQSTEFKREQINDLITRQRTEGWEFVFLGANQDAIAVASSMGISGQAAMSYASNSIGTNALYASLSSNVRSFRCSTDTEAHVSFSAEDRGAQVAAGASVGTTTGTTSATQPSHAESTSV